MRGPPAVAIPALQSLLQPRSSPGQELSTNADTEGREGKNNKSRLLPSALERLRETVPPDC